jgi:hypothetical protein
MAFDANDVYERDWFLFMARYKNAVFSAPLGPRFATLPGVTPMAKDTELDRAVSFVQAHLAKRMAVCKRQGCTRPCFFRTRKGQKYCSTHCAQLVRMAINLRWFREVGSERRRERMEKQKSLRHDAPYRDG